MGGRSTQRSATTHNTSQDDNSTNLQLNGQNDGMMITGDNNTVESVDAEIVTAANESVANVSNNALSAMEETTARAFEFGENGLNRLTEFGESMFSTVAASNQQVQEQAFSFGADALALAENTSGNALLAIQDTTQDFMHSVSNLTSQAQANSAKNVAAITSLAKSANSGGQSDLLDSAENMVMYVALAAGGVGLLFVLARAVRK